MIDLSFKNISKRYRVRQEPVVDETRHRIARMIQNLRRPAHDFWALRDVSFEVKRGEALGIIGHNGAGKSTILKLLANITAPTSGEIMINGRLAALIEVGSGFHPELTGRENIYLNGSILGMRRREITEKLDSIVEFAGVREFLDTPVKRFSSGMYVRLGFSIAAHLDPDILLLDEVLAVGDAAFQSKCLERIAELKKAGTTIVFISHDLAAVERTCDRVILLNQGQIAADGKPAEVISIYQGFESVENRHGERKHSRSAKVSLHSLRFRREVAGRDTFRTGFPFEAHLDFAVSSPVDDAVFEVLFYTPDKVVQCQFSTETSAEKVSLRPGEGTISFYCSELALLPGIFYADVSVKERRAAATLDSMFEAAVLRVAPGKSAKGQFYMPHDWELEQPVSTLPEVAHTGSH